MKCAVIILTLLHINNLSSGFQKEDAATSRGKRTVFFRKKPLLVSTPPRYDFNLLPKYYSVPVLQPYNDPEFTLERRSNSPPALEPPSIVYTEQFDSSKSPINLPPRYINANEYYVEKYVPDVLTLLNELMKPLMVNSGRRMQIKKPYENRIYYKHQNVLEIPRFEIIDRNISPVDILNTERSDTGKQLSTTTIKYNNNNSTQSKPTTESTTKSTTELTTESTTELTTELTTESTFTTISNIDEDKPDKDLRDVNADDSDNDDETGELSSTNQTLSVNETRTDEGRPDEEVNDDLYSANKTSEAGEEKDDILKKSSQFRETVKSEVAKELEFIIELLSINKLPNTNITEKKSKDIKEISKSSKKNDSNVLNRHKGEKLYDKEKSKSVFTNFEGNEHFIHFFLFHPNYDFFNLKPFDQFNQKSTKPSDEKLKSSTEQIKGSKGIDNTNNKKRDAGPDKKDSAKETNNLKASVDMRNEKNDSDSKRAEGIEKDPKKTASSLEADVSDSTKGALSENEVTDIKTAATDLKKNDSSESDDSNDSVSDLNKSKVVNLSLVDVITYK